MFAGFDGKKLFEYKIAYSILASVTDTLMKAIVLNSSTILITAVVRSFSQHLAANAISPPSIKRRKLSRNAITFVML